MSNLTMGTTLPLGLVTASKAPTPGGMDKAFKNFLRTALVCKRINDLVDGKIFAGFYYYMADNVRAMCIPKIVTPKVTAHPDGTDPLEGNLGKVSSVKAPMPWLMPLLTSSALTSASVSSSCAMDHFLYHPALSQRKHS